MQKTCRACSRNLPLKCSSNYVSTSFEVDYPRSHAHTYGTHRTGRGAEESGENELRELWSCHEAPKSCLSELAGDIYHPG